MTLVLRSAPVDSCPLCGSSLDDTLPVVASAADVSGLVGRELDVRRCTCGLSFTSPIPTESTSALLYEKRDSSNFDAEGGGIVAAVKDRLARDFIRRLAVDACGSVLDYSTGNGRFANAAAQVFPNAAIVASDIIESAPVGLAPSVAYLTNEAVSSSDRRFDLIILRHVLEHSYRPVELLGTLASRLTERGALYIEVPNLACSWRRFAGRNWPGFYAPYHAWQFTPDVLLRVISKVGLTGRVSAVSMPMMGNIVSRRLNLRETLPVKLIGMALYPGQMIAELAGGNASAMGVLATRG